MFDRVGLATKGWSPTFSLSSGKGLSLKNLRLLLLRLMNVVFAGGIAPLFLLAVGCNSPTATVEQTLNLAIPSDPATLDPRKGGDLVSCSLHFLLFDGLTRLDDQGNVALSLAKRVDISEDHRIYTFHLKECCWSDGSPITAWDFEKSWKDILTPTFPAMNAHLFYPIRNAEKAKKGLCPLSEVGVESINARTLRVTLERPTPYFLELAAFSVFYPVNAAIDRTLPSWAYYNDSTFVCSGPFTLGQWKRSNKMTLSKNPHYHRAEETRLEQIHFFVIGSEITALQLFEKGEIDILAQPMLPLDAIAHLKTQGILQVNPIPATTFCTFNVNQFPFNNVNIRKAFGYAIDRGRIVDNITQLSEMPALEAIPPILKKVAGGSRPFFHDADVAAAKHHFQRGLEELGITARELPKIHFLYSNSDAHHKIAQALQQQWRRALNVSIELQKVDKKNLIHLLKTRNYELAMTFWMAQYLDAMNIFQRFEDGANVTNYASWENSDYRALLTQSCLAKTAQERFALLEQAEEILLEEMPIAPIFHWTAAYIAQPWIRSHGTIPVGNGFFDRVYIDAQIKRMSETESPQ